MHDSHVEAAMVYSSPRPKISFSPHILFDSTVPVIITHEPNNMRLYWLGPLRAENN